MKKAGEILAGKQEMAGKQERSGEYGGEFAAGEILAGKQETAGKQERKVLGEQPRIGKP